MFDCVITFRSVMPAQQAQRLLQRSGIRCALRRTPKHLGNRGCGYGVYLPADRLRQAIGLLDSSTIRYNKLFTEANTQLPQEVIV